MNKKVLYFIAFLYLLFIPIKINAVSYESAITSFDNPIEFISDEFIIDLKYDQIDHQSTDSPGALAGYSVRKIDNAYYYHYIVYYYDNEGNEIGATDGYNGIWSQSLSSPTDCNGTPFFSQLNQNDMYGYYQLSDIKNYKLFIEPASMQTVNNYLYNQQKINKDGIDPITDFDTKYMSQRLYNQSGNENYNQPITYDYTIDKYHIDIIVNENNTLDITEKISAYFYADKHGIFRTIPLNNTVIRLDGTTSKNRTVVSNLKVSDPYKTSRAEGNFKIQIGDADKTISGPKDYEIKYTYNLGKDPVKDYDELYFNIIGTEWDTTIDNVSFTITMPKDFDESKLGLAIGEYGSSNNNNIVYKIEDNKITGYYKSKLNVGEGITVRCELEEGYFVGAGIPTSPLVYIVLFLPFLFLVISYFIWLKYGKDRDVVETIEFYPPEGFNSLEIAYLYKGNVDDKDITSLLVYLANKGYIKIIEAKEKNLFRKSGFKIIKLKEYDGNNQNEATFMKGLFKKQRSIKKDNITSIINAAKKNGEKLSKEEALEFATRYENLQYVTEYDLKDSFYTTMNKISNNINSSSNKNKIFEKVANGKRKLIILMIIATFAVISLPITVIDDPELFIVALLFPGLGLSALFTAIFGLNNNTPKSIRLFFVIWGAGFGGVPCALMIIPVYLQELPYLIGYLLGLGCVIGMILLIKFMPKRTQYGTKMLGRILGFKDFLETAEKDKLEALVMENPTYFYDILPYTYVLDISTKWISKFETIAIKAPDWLDSSTDFNLYSFGERMSKTMDNAQSSMGSSPSSSSCGGSSSGSSSGGGSSGGGSGGGGGGSW